MEDKFHETSRLMDEISNEADFIAKARSKFENFLKVANDSTETDFNTRIAYEKAKVGFIILSESCKCVLDFQHGEHSKLYKKLSKQKAEYLDGKQIVDKDVKKAMEEINEYVSQLCQLQHYGKRFMDVVNFVKSDCSLELF